MKSEHQFFLPLTLIVCVVFGVLFFKLSNKQLVQTKQPLLIFKGTEPYEAGGMRWTRYLLEVRNHADFPDDLFEPSPNLPPCELNNSSSRTWVDVVNAVNDSWIYGFCDLASSKELDDIWFSVQEGALPPNAVYVQFTDRKDKQIYRSNPVSLNTAQ